MQAQPLPIGLAYVAGYLDHTRHTVKTLDLMFAGDDYLDEVEHAVHAFRPECALVLMGGAGGESHEGPHG